jgi:hypothetical protein
MDEPKQKMVRGCMSDKALDLSLTSPACVDLQAAFRVEVREYIKRKIVPALSLEQLVAKSFGIADAAAAIDWAATSGRWKVSSDGWMRELDITAEDSHLLAYYATSVWGRMKAKARTELKKKQEQELRKRTAEGQPEGTAGAKRGKQA